MLNEIRHLQSLATPSLMVRYEAKQGQVRKALADYKKLSSESNRGSSRPASRDVNESDLAFCVDSLLPDLVERIFRGLGGGRLIGICFEAVIDADNTDVGIAELRRRLVDAVSMLIRGNDRLLWRIWLLLSFEAHQSGRSDVESSMVGLAVADYVNGPVSKAQITYLANLAPRSRYLFALIAILLEGMDGTKVCHFSVVRDLVQEIAGQVERSHNLLRALSQEFRTRGGPHFKLFRHEVAWVVGRSFEAIRMAEEIWSSFASDGSNVGNLADTLREFLLRERRFGTDAIAADIIMRFNFAVETCPVDVAVFEGGEQDQGLYGVGALAATMERLYKRTGTPVLGIVGGNSNGNRTYLERGRRGQRIAIHPSRTPIMPSK